MDTLNSLRRTLASLKLTYAILILFMLAAVAAGLIPQGLSEGEYLQRFGDTFSRLVLLLGLDRFGSSPVMRGLAGLFFLNLGACTLPRFLRRLKRGRFLKLGPDLTHLGLLLLLAAIALGAGGGLEEQTVLRKGEGFSVGGRRIHMSGIERRLRGDSGLRREVVLLRVEGEAVQREQAELRVNDPYRFGGYRLLLLGIERVFALRLQGPSGRELLFGPGEGGVNDDFRFLVISADSAGATVEINGREELLQPGAELSGLRVLGTGETERALLMVQRRRGGWALILAGGLIALGAGLSFFSREA